MTFKSQSPSFSSLLIKYTAVGAYVHGRILFVSPCMLAVFYDLIVWWVFFKWEGWKVVSADCLPVSLYGKSHQVVKLGEYLWL